MKLTWYHKETKNTRTSSEEKAAELLCNGWIEGKYEDPIKKLESNKKRSETVKRIHLERSQEESDLIKEKIKKTLLSKSDEEKVVARKKYSDTVAKRPPEYERELREARRKTYESFSDEKKEEIKQKFRATMDSKTEAELLEIHVHRSDATKKYFSSLTEDQRLQFSSKMSEVYSNFTDEQKAARAKKISETFKKTCLKKYNVLNTLQLPQVQEKVKLTNLQKYGVPYACQLPQCRLHGNDSKPNKIFENLLITNNINYEREFSISRYSYDFKVGNILIEINPFATHNSTWSPFGNAPKDKNYHQDKTKIAIENGYRCINIWDWDDLDKILSLLLPKEKIYARKCHIKLIDDISVVDSFLNIYHLQETCKGQLICLGLYFENKLVQLMTFGKPRYNKNYEYELLRLCSDSNYIIVGGAEKLFKYFITNYFPKSIISYCDNSKFSGDVYYRLGMSLSKYGTPSAHWYSPELNKHITDNLLRQQGFDRLLGKDFGSFGKNTDNEELMIFHGFVKIFDCGQSVFEWKNV